MGIIKYEPENFKLEQTTIWSFPERGRWATHSGKYRGNWSPYVPRNLILRYSNVGDWVLDQFLGSGTTLVEARLLGRNAIGVDVNPKAIEISQKNIDFPLNDSPIIRIRKGDAKNLDFIETESIDLICTHPPYANIIHYSENIIEDISYLSYDGFIKSLTFVANEAYRVLKKDGICSFMIGDIRENGDTKPLGMESMKAFIDSGFILKEIIIKEQHNCRSTSFWKSRAKSFLLLEHEYIFVFTKRKSIIS